MSDRWWTWRIAILTLILSVGWFAVGYKDGRVDGYSAGYSDCADYVLELLAVEE